MTEVDEKAVVKIRAHMQMQQKMITLLATLLVIMTTIGAGVGVLVSVRLAVAPKDVYLQVEELQKNIGNIALADHQNRHLMHIMEDDPRAIVGLDVNGQVVMWSSGAEDLFGFTREQVLGYGPAFLMPKDMLAGHRQGFTKSMSQEGKPFRREITCEAKTVDGMISVDIDLTCIPQRLAIAVIKRSDK